MKTKDIDRTKLTPKRVSDIIGSSLKLIELHERQRELMWELLAGVCYEAPIPNLCEIKRAGINAIAIKTQTYWLVYQPGAKHLVQAMVEGKMTDVMVPPRPIGVLIPSGAMKTKRVYTATEGTTEHQVQLYYAVARARKLGEFDATRGMMEIAQFYNVR